MLTDGIEVEYRHDGGIKGDKVWLIDFERPENNEFLAVNQFTVIENNINKRPDLALFINGLPLVGAQPLAQFQAVIDKELEG